MPSALPAQSLVGPLVAYESIIASGRSNAAAQALQEPSQPSQGSTGQQDSQSKPEHDASAGDSPSTEKPKQKEKESPRTRRRLAGLDPCALTEIKGQAWIDRLHRGLHRAVCDSALWFDDLFGDELHPGDSQGTYGRLLLGVEYNDREEVDEISRFRAHFSLPNAERRISGFVGHGDREELISDKAPRTGALPTSLDIPDDDEWLVGLGYSPQRSSRTSSWSYDVGVDVEFPLNWYAKARYKRVLFPSDASMLRLRQTFFWEREDGWGSTSRLDYDYLLANEKLIRWRNIATFSEGDRGIDWYTELTLFQNRGQHRALAYQFAASGETDADVTLEFVLGRVIYRRRILRDWFYLDIRPGISYRRDQNHRNREFRPMLAIGAEILFGKHP